MLCSCAEAARGACRGSAAPYRPWLWRARCQPRPDRGRTTTSGTRRFGRAGARAVSERGRARVRGGHGLVGAGRGRGWRGREKMTGKTLSMLPSIESSLIRSAAKPRQTERKRFRATQRAWTLDSRPPPEQPGAPCRRQVLGHTGRKRIFRKTLAGSWSSSLGHITTQKVHAGRTQEVDGSDCSILSVRR